MSFWSKLSSNQSLMNKLDGAELIGGEEIRRKFTAEHPQWIHFGAGNIFRSFVSEIAQKLICSNSIKGGIIVADAFDHDIIDKCYKPNDNHFLLCLLNPDGDFTLNLISSVAEALAPCNNSADMARIQACFENPSLEIVSFSITEKGYDIRGMDGQILPEIARDIKNGIDHPTSTLPLLLCCLWHRYNICRKGLTLLAFDNCYHNGDKLCASVHDLIALYRECGELSGEFVQWIDDGGVTFPLTMIDRITPRPTAAARKQLLARGFEEIDPVLTHQGISVAPYVNAEPISYLVVEDHFAGSRPAFERAGVKLSSRQKVILCENMKIETCLNPLQTSLAIFGILLSKRYISDCMADPDLNKMIRLMGKEGIAVVQDPEVISPEEFLREVIEERLPNRYIFDQPARIATDSSNKINIRCGLTIEKYAAAGLDPLSLKAVPLTIAAYVRYLCQCDDDHVSYQMAPDPKMDYLSKIGRTICIEDPLREDSSAAIDNILNNKMIIGCSLADHGLFSTVKEMIVSMCQLHGVRKTLQKTLRE